MPVFSVSLDETEFRDLRKRMRVAFGNPTALLKRVGWIMVRSVDTTFRDGGKRADWDKLSPMTLSIRKWRAGGGGDGGHPAYTDKILEVQGRLRKNWEIKVTKGRDGGSVRIASGEAVADTQHLGKTIPAPKSWETRSTVTIPKRTLIQFFPDDIKAIEDAADRFAEEAIR